MLKIGHKGTSENGTPENTLLSVRRAIMAGVDGVEFDLRRTKEGLAVVIHDDTVNNMTDGIGRVRNMTLEQLKRLSVGGTDEKIPTVDEMLKNIGSSLKVIFIEIKDQHLERQTLEAVYENKIHERAVIISFNKQILRNVRGMSSGITLGLDHKSPINAINFALEVGADYLISRAQDIKANFVRDANSKGISVVAWTVNDVKEVARLKELGVQGIISDFTNLW